MAAAFESLWGHLNAGPADHRRHGDGSGDPYRFALYDHRFLGLCISENQVQEWYEDDQAGDQGGI